MPAVDLQVPSYCAHEHWGSIAAIGAFAGGFRADIEPGALPSRRVGLLDLLLDPYFGGNLATLGLTIDKLAQMLQVDSLFTLSSRQTAAIWPALREIVSNHLLTGTFQSLRMGIRDLYGIDILYAGGQDIQTLDEAIASNYASLFSWYQDAMARCWMSALVRPVHPDFYLVNATSVVAQQESTLMRTVMRLDPLLDFWKPDSPRRARLASALDIDPVDAATWRAFIEALFDLAERRGAVGIKQLQAYSRPLSFRLRADGEVRFRGELTDDGIRCFQDWLVHACSAQAHERGWPQQVHVGTHNITESSPMPLLDLAKRYPRMKIVQLHCWPFLQEAGWLAKHVPNIYIDTCWLPILNPEYYTQALQGWLHYVPVDKICCSHDATSIEMAAGSLHISRHLMGDILAAQQTKWSLSDEQVHKMAAAFFNDNAAALYRNTEKD
ncbi:MAG: amidohydrolase family protein [Chloroflexi bacterium]|nr:amidohydrolase family protein [Chloroflexota bacterium]